MARPIVSGVLVVAQGLLGAVVVEENLEEELVAAHLGLAMLLLALVLYIWRASRPDVIGAEPPRVSRGFRRLAIVAPIAILLTIVAGGYMAGTQNYGRPTTSSATAPTTPAARSSPPATASSCRSATPAWWTST